MRAPQIRTGTGFLWRPLALRGEPADVVRVHAEGGLTLAALANGSGCGFSACWPPASRLILDLFVEAWRATSEPARERLLRAFAVARAQFEARAAALVLPDTAFPDELPIAVLLAVVTDGATAHMAWIGGDVAVVARNGAPIVATTPHTLVERYRRELPELVDVGALPNVIVRCIRPKSSDDEPPDEHATEVMAGDTIVLMGRAPFRGPLVPVTDAAALAARISDPPALAQIVNFVSRPTGR